ncbi:hypothetical protein ABFS82_08G144500 [Erythranthe guttata]
MASVNTVTLTLFCLTLVTLFIPHECVENNNKEILTGVNGDQKQQKGCLFLDCGHGNPCWCCGAGPCYATKEACLQKCPSPKFPRKIVS